MVQQVSTYSLSGVTFIFVSIYLVFVMPAAVVLPVMLLGPLVIFYSNRQEQSACIEFTKAACDLRRVSGACNQIQETFENDKEWKAYRFAVCNQGLGQKASTARLKKSYSEAAFNDCEAQAVVIEEQINSFSESDCENQNDLEGSTVLLEGFYGSWIFLMIGCVGILFSFALIANRFNNKFSVRYSRQNGVVGDN